ncbi:hypothetical protein PSHT_01440 [Puccinia striiformis]|uniref:SLC41A/MgtE integral membrane domain-containing protein n=1 Tax=Puccinia striiformis TaxID=27350 RepID=A0A2S4WKM8_9BASI|nr:hypothetical protein PSHT_01440 [Puccinia striiformis]
MMWIAVDPKAEEAGRGWYFSDPNSGWRWLRVSSKREDEKKLASCRGPVVIDEPEDITLFRGGCRWLEAEEEELSTTKRINITMEEHQQHLISFKPTHRRSSSSATDTTITHESLKHFVQSTQEEPPFRKRRLQDHHQPSFSVLTLLIQTLPSLLVSVLGGILTGLLLEHVQDWTAFVRVPELYILLPVLMNLKGNLEMNLAARLSTSANVGDLDTPKGRNSLVKGNLTLLQVQAIIVSFTASLLSFTLGVLSRNNLPTLRIASTKPIVGAIVQSKLPSINWNTPLQGGYSECLLVLAAGMLAASVNSLLLGGLVCGLVIACRILKINPDNITTPIASSLGDLMTLIFLSLTASIFIRYAERSILTTTTFMILTCSIILHVYFTYKNEYVRGSLKVGWTPLFMAMLISTCSGLVLEKVVIKYHGFAVIAPVLTGICGNIGTISVSRISTSLHASKPLGDVSLRPSSSSSIERKSNQFLKDDHSDLDLEEDTHSSSSCSEEEVLKDQLDIDLDFDPTSSSSSTDEPVRKVGIVLLLLSTFILAGFALIHLSLDRLNPSKSSVLSGLDWRFFIGFMICVI